MIQNVIGAVGPNAPPRKKKDVVRIPARTGAKGQSNSVTRLVMVVDDTGRTGRIEAQGKDATYQPNGDWTSGGWLVHCHILEHSGRGMLSFYEVRDPNDPFVLLGKHLDGTNGRLHLTGRTPLISPAGIELDLIGALGSTNCFMLLGASQARLPIFGGEIVPGQPAFAIAAVTDPQGEFSWSFPGWEVLWSGAQLWFQVIQPDINAVQNVSMSNAVLFTRP